MKKILFALTLALACLFMTGCFGGSEQVVRYYTIALPGAKANSLNPELPYRVVVKKASIDPAYRRNNIVYRESAYDFMFYNYSVWAARPEYLIEQSFANYLKQRNLFAVVETDATAKPDYEVNIRVNAIEEVDNGSDRSAHLAIAVLFNKVGAEGLVWAKEYDETKSYSGSDVRNFAETVSALLNTFVTDAAEGIRKAVQE